MHARHSTRWRVLEGAGVVQLAAEIEPAQEAENLAQWRALVAANALGYGELRSLVEEKSGPLSAAAGGGEQEDSALLHGLK